MMQQKSITDKFMDKQTLKSFIQGRYSDKGEGFIALFSDLESASKTINDKLKRHGLIEESGKSGWKNVYGEELEKLDEYADKILMEKLLANKAVYGVGSEEMPEPKFSPDKFGDYIVTYDPMDGSSNIDTNLSIGTIFGIYPKSDTILQKGSLQIASGYILYGPSMMFVFATKSNVYGFTMDPDKGEFVLTYPEIKIPEGKIYSINEGNCEIFESAEKLYLTSIKKEGGYSLRYVGSMVADVHRTLLKGGIFLYPSDKKHENGKLRLLYEVAPLSFLIKAAGGKAMSGGVDPLDIKPSKIDQRVPIVLGSKHEVEKYLQFKS